MSSELEVRRGPAGLLPHQLEVVRDRVSKIRVVQGGYRSGKTVTGVACVVDMGFRSGGHPILVVAPTYTMVRDVFVATAQRMLDLWELPWDYHKSEHVLTIGRQQRFHVLCRSAEKPRSIEGLTAGGALIDEWELCPRQALVTTFARVSMGPCQQILLTGTAESFGPGYDLVLANKAPTTRLWSGVHSKRNTFLDPGYLAMMAANLDEDEAAEKLGGERRAKGGVVYSRFSRNIHCSAPPCVVAGEGEIQVWADFNTVGKMCWVVAEVDRDGGGGRGCAHILGELIGKDTLTDAHAVKMKTYLAKLLTATRRRRYDVEDIENMRVPVWCDASGVQQHRGAALTHVGLLQQAKFRPHHGRRNPLIVDRVNTVNVMLRDRRLTFDAVEAPWSTKCIEQQTYVNGVPDKDNGLDGVVDAIGYGCHWQFPAMKRPRGSEREGSRDLAA